LCRNAAGCADDPSLAALPFAKIATGGCGSQKKEPAADAVRKTVGQDWVYGAYRVYQILPEDAG